MSLRDALTREAQRFLREEVNPQRDAENAKRFKRQSAQIVESTVVMPMRKIEPDPPVIEETFFSPNSNAQGL